MEFLAKLVLVTIPTFVAGFSGWFFTRRKYVASAEGKEIQNVDKAAAIWRELAQNLKDEMDVLVSNQKMLMEDNRKLLFEISKLEVKVQTLSRENRKLRELIETKS